MSYVLPYTSRHSAFCDTRGVHTAFGHKFTIPHSSTRSGHVVSTLLWENKTFYFCLSSSEYERNVLALAKKSYCETDDEAYSCLFVIDEYRYWRLLNINHIFEIKVALFFVYSGITFDSKTMAQRLGVMMTTWFRVEPSVTLTFI